MGADADPEQQPRPALRYLLPRAGRLRVASDFDDAFSGGTSTAGRFMILRTRDGEGADRRLGAVAGKKTFPRAVDRSRAKRQIREAFRRVRYRLDNNVDYVLIARRRILDAGSGEILNDFEKLASRKGLLKAAADSK